MAVYRQKSGGALAFIMMQGESSGTFDAALNPIEYTTLFAWERKTEADVKGDFGDPPHAYFMKPSSN
ncbi:hypothetical protein I5L16_14255 [Serratia marcescens]|uniref:hypothetical protein n=1 Tax=Serratia TaxID=613 RepID=UPI000A6E6DE8|nr:MULTISPECIES: hypothetical protein [Serratia]ELD1855797.1 hypothetical protein [Serratia marcescens]ELH4205831.1 hypothetical protein [Serratia marcescens]ELM0004574.1 hypothetical protein [Serratia marcescens]MBH2569792.1 hypothetical protein [Serratia marcescens]MBH2778299.1 hypothetical protein [Serratia marcescens]